MTYRLSIAIEQARFNRDKRDGLKGSIRHTYGNCGGIAGLCAACYEDEFKDMADWANKQPRPAQNEDVVDYWKRIGGKFYDAWYEIARQQYPKA